MPTGGSVVIITLGVGEGRLRLEKHLRLSFGDLLGYAGGSEPSERGTHRLLSAVPVLKSLFSVMAHHHHHVSAFMPLPFFVS